MRPLKQCYSPISLPESIDGLELTRFEQRVYARAVICQLEFALEFCGEPIGRPVEMVAETLRNPTSVLSATLIRCFGLHSLCRRRRLTKTTIPHLNFTRTIRYLIPSTTVPPSHNVQPTGACIWPAWPTKTQQCSPKISSPIFPPPRSLPR